MTFTGGFDDAYFVGSQEPLTLALRYTNDDATLARMRGEGGCVVGPLVHAFNSVAGA